MNLELILKDRNLDGIDNVIKTFENKSTILTINLDEKYKDDNIYLEFEKPDGEKSITPKLNVIFENDKMYVKYDVPSSLLNKKGLLKMEVVIRDGKEQIFKSYAYDFKVLESINANDDIVKFYPDFITEAQKTLDIIKINGDGTKYLNDKGEYLEVQGGSGVKNYNDLENKPSINDVELFGNKTLDDLNIQIKGNYALKEEIPTNVSQLTNDKEYQSKNDVELLISNKADKIEIPTKNSELDNDSNYITNAVKDLTNYYLKSETYTQSEVNDLINKITTISIEVVDNLPTENIKENVIYLVPNKSEEEQNVYDEYIYINNKFEKIGNTKVDLTDYALKSEIPTVPTKVSELENDSKYLTTIPVASTSSIGGIKISKYFGTEVNSSGQLVIADVAYSRANSGQIIVKNMLEQAFRINDFASKSDIPTDLGDLTNNADYATNADVDTKISEAITTVLAGEY